MKMLNNNLLCKGEEVTDTTRSGFEVKSQKAYKELQIIQSSEEDLPIGTKILVPVNSGTKTAISDQEVQIIHRLDVIMVL